MCGRYGRRADKQRIAEWMQTHNTDVFDDSYLAPSYNVAPQSFQPVVRLDSETGERELTVMRWGLIPFWILLANSDLLQRFGLKAPAPTLCYRTILATYSCLRNRVRITILD